MQGEASGDQGVYILEETTLPPRPQQEMQSLGQCSFVYRKIRRGIIEKGKMKRKRRGKIRGKMK
jgi:hypothetical protein